MTRYILPFALVTALVGCKPDDDDNGNHDGDDTDEQASSGRIQGDASGSGVVTVTTRAQNGFQDAETESVRTNANGHFVVEVDYEDQIDNIYIVHFDGDDGSHAAALVYGVVTADSTLDAPDLDEESTVEAMVYASLVERGLADDGREALMTRILVDRSVAAMVIGDIDDGGSADPRVDETADMVAAADAAISTSLHEADRDWTATFEDRYTAHDHQEAADGAFDGSLRGDLDVDALLANLNQDRADRDTLMVGLHAASEAVDVVSMRDNNHSWAEATLVTMLAVERNRYSGEILAGAMADLGIDTSASDSEFDQFMADLEEFFEDLEDGRYDGDQSLDTLMGVRWTNYESAVLLDLTLALDADQEADVADSLAMALDLRADVDAKLRTTADFGDAASVGTVAYSEFDGFCADTWDEVHARLVNSGHFTSGEADAIATIIVQLAASGSAS